MKATPDIQRRRLLGAGAALAGATVLPRRALADAGPILLGQSAPLSGPAAALGQQFRLGAQLAFERANAAGGVGGRMIELRSLDDGFDRHLCAANTRTLIEAGCVALFGYVGTANSLAAMPLATDAGRVFFAPFTGSEALRIPFNRLVFHVRSSYVDETQSIVRHLGSVGLHRIGVCCQNDGDGKAGLLGVTRALKAEYRAPVGIGFIGGDNVHADTAAEQILAGKPDAIVLASAYGPAANFIRVARRAGFGGVFYNVSFVGGEALARTLGGDAKGVVVSQVMPFPFSPLTRVAAEYLAAGHHRDGAAFSPSYVGIEGFVAARALIEGLRRAGRDPAAGGLVTGLESLHAFDLGGFNVDFGPGRHAGSRFNDLTILSDDGRVRA
jgi:ABC-type branched-subunit amino acid transport system substrate-binding protein